MTVDGMLAVVSVVLLIPIVTLFAGQTATELNGLSTFGFVEVYRNEIAEFGLSFFLWVFVGVNLLKAFSDLLATYLALKIKYEKSRVLSLSVASSYLNASYQFLNKLDRGTFLNTLSRENSKYADAVGMTLEAFNASFQLAIYIIVPLILTPFIAMSTICVMILVSIPFLFLSRFARHFGDVARVSANRCSKSIFEIVNYGSLFKMFDVSQTELIKYNRQLETHISASKKSTLMSRAISSLLQPISVFAAISAISISVWQGNSFFLAAPILWSVLRAYPLVSKVLGINFAIHTLLPSRQQVDRLLDQLSDNKQIVGFKRLEKVDQVSLHRTAFSYGDDKVVLNNVSHAFHVGEVTLISGKSGVGKSTLIKLIQGHLFATDGDVKIAGLNITELDLGHLSKKLGYLDQEVVLLNRTIYENLCLGTNYPADTLIKACEAAGALEIIESMPNGFETVVEENGANFSGGERQRLGLARILLRDPDVLILDEPTSALDAINRDLIMKMIRAMRKDKIIIIISHDEFCKKYADVCMFLENKRVRVITKDAEL